MLLLGKPPVQTTFRPETDDVKKPWSGLVGRVWLQWFMALFNLLNALVQNNIVFSGQSVNANLGNVLLVNTVNAPGSGTVTVNLPPVGPPAGLTKLSIPIRVMKTSPDGNSVSITPNGTDRINGVNAPFVLATQYAKATLFGSGVIDWYVFG